MKCLAKGRTAEVYEWNEDKILKLFNKNLSERIAKTEYENGILLNDLEVRVPKAYELKKINGRFGIVYERIYGKSLLSMMISKFISIKEAAFLLAEIHYKVNSLEVADLPEQKSSLKVDIEETNWLSKSEKLQIVSRLKEFPALNRLCHGDFHPDNLILTSNGPVIVDWLTAVSGNPACDVARTVIMFKFAELPDGLPVSSNAELKKIHDIYLNKYLELSKLENEEIREWELVVAAARLNEGIPDGEKDKLVKFIRSEI